MEESLSLEDFKKIFLSIEKKLQDNKEYLSKLDSFIGDGDHGLTITRGFKNVVEIIETDNFNSISELLILIGAKLTSTMGGVSGVIFGTLFKAMGEVITQKEYVSLADLYHMFLAALEKIKQVGKAKPGDKTMIDSLEPAVMKLNEMLKTKIPLKDAVFQMAKAAEQGAISTKNMIALKGRAKFLGERSIGYQDAGATSFYLILNTMYEAI